MKRNLPLLIVVLALFLAVGSCTKTEHLARRTPNLPATPYQYDVAVVVPPGSPYVNCASNVPVNNAPVGNPVTNAGATLGRVLFYENLLTVNNSINCGSCHKQNLAFSDDRAFSTGYKGQLGARNALPLTNEFMNSSFFWDARVNTLEAQTLQPVKNHAEMGLENMSNLVTKLQSVSYYPPLFQAAFGSSEITAGRIADALAQFVRAMNTFNSKFDQGVATGFSNFTPQEVLGEATFRQFHCNSCHGGNNLNIDVTFSGSEVPVNDFANSGLDINSADAGYMDVTNNTADNGVFKIPSLRNVALTAPYMHDGRYSTLEQVIEHYNSGIQPSANLDSRLTVAGWGLGTTNAPVKMNMTDDQKTALVAFLNTLTDYQFISDPKFSDPFK